ncbi:MAG: multicopper oxidase family protein, partial [Thiobacillus sp.]|nr:multicopper oxidase family protein [Thiobacillus sp.]
TPIAGYTRFAYNDGDGSTGYHKAYPLQLGSLDHNFHDSSEAVQPLPFAEMRDTYTLFNGRGYPDTVVSGPLPAPNRDGELLNSSGVHPNGVASQKVSSAISINRMTEGTKLLLRLSNLNVTNYYTVTALGLPMRVVGGGAHIARGPDGKDLYYDTASVTLGGGEAVDVIVDTAGVPAGTYFLYTTNLNYLSNNDQDFGGMMTEIVVQN